MKIPLNIAAKLFGCALLALGCSASADTRLLGVITASGGITVSGQGNWSDGDSVFGDSGQDNLALSLQATVQYQVTTDGTNLFISSQLPAQGFSATASLSASGGQHGSEWDYTHSPPTVNTIDWTYTGDPSFRPQDESSLIRIDNSTNGPNQFICASARPTYGCVQNGVFVVRDAAFGDDSYTWPWPPLFPGSIVGEHCVNRAMDLVQSLSFTITNTTDPWTLNLFTNVAVHYQTNSTVAPVGSESGAATASNVVTLSYAPYKRVGVLTVGYTNNGSASLTWAFTWTYAISGWDGTCGCEVTYVVGPCRDIGSDQIQSFNSGSAQYEVLQSLTNAQSSNNLVIGNLLTNSGQETISGNGHYSWLTLYSLDWDTGQWFPSDEENPSWVNSVDYWDPGFSPTNLCVAVIQGPNDPTLFFGACRSFYDYTFPRYGYNLPDYAANYPLDSPTLGAMWGLNAYDLIGNPLLHAEDFQFVFTNAATNWSQTIATNVASHTSYSDATGSGSGNGFASSTITLQYVPDQPTVKFTASPTNGPVPLTVQCNSGTTDSGSGTITNWNWDFGDGATADDQSPTHTYTRAGNFTVGLVCTNDRGQAVTGLGPATITLAGPTIPFTASPTNGLAPLTVNFSADSGGATITNWTWNFGDGVTTNVQSPTHTYTNGSNFTVTLTATNAGGAALYGVGPTPIVVTLPTAEFSAFPTTGPMPLPVALSGPTNDSGTNAILSWSWDFGDLTTSTVQKQIHTYTYSKSKTFSPKLTVTNIWGMALKATGPKISATYPTILFTASPTNGQIPLHVQFNAPNLDGFGVPLTNWSWNFGDGATGRGQNPSHTYTNIGAFVPALTAINTNGTAVNGFGPSISAGWSQVYTFGATGSSGYDTNINATTNREGIHPQAGLALSSNGLYGCMSAGGNSGSGTIFAVNTDGSNSTNLYQFSALATATSSNSDGGRPVTRLVLSGQTLYGATPAGGMGYSGGGTVFRINTDGSSFTNLHNFSYGSNEGTKPNGLILSGNTLYGTASAGGSNGSGTIFSLNTDGSGFAVLYAFSGSTYNYSISNYAFFDGTSPLAPVLLASNVLYGTASKGGLGGGGTLFKLNPDGSGFTVLHSLTNNEGITPKGELVLSGNTLYGTASAGGSSSNGTVFQVNTDGTGFAPLYVFSATAYDNSNFVSTNADGANPSAGLLLVGNTLYGTTQNGGAGGSGTVFAITTDGTRFTTVYSFSRLSYSSDVLASTNLDGANPFGSLVLSAGYLYGTACNGGPAGDGAIFAVSVLAAAPTLDIQFNGQDVIISWPSSATGWTLQQCANLIKADWSASTFAILNDGTNNRATVSPLPGQTFFRLAK